jgi:hypothetical protein
MTLGCVLIFFCVLALFHKWMRAKRASAQWSSRLRRISTREFSSGSLFANTGCSTTTSRHNMPTQLEYRDPQASRDMDQPDYGEFSPSDTAISQYPTILYQTRIEAVYILANYRTNTKLPEPQETATTLSSTLKRWSVFFQHCPQHLNDVPLHTECLSASHRFSRALARTALIFYIQHHVGRGDALIELLFICRLFESLSSFLPRRSLKTMGHFTNFRSFLSNADLQIR